MKKEDCFAIGQRGGCAATTRIDCDKCPFYKTAEQFRDDTKAAEKVLYNKGLRGVAKSVSGFWECGGVYTKLIMTTERRSG